MICPECGSEYREGFTRCSDCEIELVEPVPAQPEVELVRVYQGGNPAILPIVESLLRESAIEFMTTGQSVQALQGAIGSPFVVPVEFWVRDDDEAAALELLAGIDDAPVAEE